MPALIHKSLTEAPEILLTLVSTFSIGFLLWFLVGLLREARRMRSRQVHTFRVQGGRVLEFEHRDHPEANAAPRVRTIKITAEVRKAELFSAPDQPSPKHAVKVRWMIICFVLTAAPGGFQTRDRPGPLLPAAESRASPVPPMVAGPFGTLNPQGDHRRNHSRL